MALRNSAVRRSAGLKSLNTQLRVWRKQTHANHLREQTIRADVTHVPIRSASVCLSNGSTHVRAIRRTNRHEIAAEIDDTSAAAVNASA